MPERVFNMMIEIRGSTVPLSEALEEHTSRRLTFALRRFADRIERVVVRLIDLNGPKSQRLVWGRPGRS
jgi:hypothetical protein